MAQFLLESGWGTSELAVEANNGFGMKTSLSGNTWPGSTWKGDVYDKETNTIKLINSYGGKSELIKIKEVSELKLVLDFDGKEKTFYSIEGMYLKDNPLPIAGIEYKTKEDVRIEFKKDAEDNNMRIISFYSNSSKFDDLIKEVTA